MHFCLTQGRCAAAPDAIPDLVHADGTFRLSASALILANTRTMHKQGLAAQIRTELHAQLALARDWGVNLTHVDSHQHIHMNPATLDIVQDVAPHYGVHTIRVCREPLLAPILPFESIECIRRLNAVKWTLIRLRLRGAKIRLKTTDYYYGILHSGAMTFNVLQSLVRWLPSGKSLEIGLHPGFPPTLPPSKDSATQFGIDHFTLSPFRRKEHDALVNLQLASLLSSCGLELNSFTGLPKPRL